MKRYYCMELLPLGHIKAGFCPATVWRVKEKKKTFFLSEYGADKELDLQKKQFIPGEFRPIKQGAEIEKFTIGEEDGFAQGYQGIYNLLQKHGFDITYRLLGLNKSNYGDQYIIDQIRMLDQLGQVFLDYCNKIAEIDFLIKEWMETKHDIRFSGYGHDLWMENAIGISFRQPPFLGVYVRTWLMGLIRLDVPEIDVFNWNNALMGFYVTHAPVCEKDEKGGYVLKTAEWFDGISLHEHLIQMVGKENADWVINTL